MAKEEEKASVEKVVGELEKRFGRGIVILNSTLPNVEFQSTGIKSVDMILGGGFAKGRIHEIYGPESSGKTTLALHVIAEVQKAGGLAAFVDAEHALDGTYARALGVSTDNLIISQPDNGEQALEVAETLIRSGLVQLCVVDSVAALVPKAEIEGEMGDSHMGLQARLMSQAMRKMCGITASTNTMMLFINQIRMKIGVMFGNPETTTGGNALKFYASQRVEVRRSGFIKDGEEVIANQTRIKVVKNKVSPPFKETDVVIRYGHGIDTANDLLHLAVERNIVEKSGSWYSYKSDRLGQGEENASEFLKTHPETYVDIANQIK